jgi:hypothetical protein
MCGVSCEKLPGAFLRKGHKRKVHLSGGIRCPGKVGGRRSFSRAGDEKNSGFKVEGKKKKGETISTSTRIICPPRCHVCLELGVAAHGFFFLVS